MSKIFIGGSREVKGLDPAVSRRLRDFISQAHTILVGDARGADDAVQAFLADCAYPHVVVYCMDGEVRANLGKWPVVSVDSGGLERGFEYFALKDERMSRDADFGFMLWDEESPGTLNNIKNLLQQNKETLVYLYGSGEFLPLNSMQEFRSSPFFSHIAG